MCVCPVGTWAGLKPGHKAKLVHACIAVVLVYCED